MTTSSNILREHIRKELAKCRPEQIALFNKMYKSVDDILEDKMSWAIHQIERTLENNEKEEKLK